VALLLVGPIVVMGWWLASHAQTNPSGGFQGGLALGFAYLYNFLPPGKIPGSVSSSGTIALIRHRLMQIFPFLVVAWIVAVGLYGLATSRDLIHQMVCLIVVQSSTYVLQLGVGYVTGGVAPYLPGRCSSGSGSCCTASIRSTRRGCTGGAGAFGSPGSRSRWPGSGWPTCRRSAASSGRAGSMTAATDASGPAGIEAAAVRFQDQAGYAATILSGARVLHPVSPYPPAPAGVTRPRWPGAA
jgi:hypothetical protein